MSKTNREPAFVVTVHMVDGRSTTQTAHTLKAARHYAKGVAGTRVQRVTVAGPGVSSELYSAA